MPGKPRRLPRSPEVRRLEFEPARKFDKTMMDHNFRCLRLFLSRRSGISKTRFSGRHVVSQVPTFSQVAKENRLNLLYESHPAETQVDGLPRAASLNRKI